MNSGLLLVVELLLNAKRSISGQHINAEPQHVLLVHDLQEVHRGLPPVAAGVRDKRTVLEAGPRSRRSLALRAQARYLHGNLVLDFEEEVTKATVIAHAGAVVSEAVQKLLAPAGGNA